MAGLGDDMSRAAFGVGSSAETVDAPSGLAQVGGFLYNSIGDLAKRAFGASETMRAGGTYDPAPAVETSLGLVGAPAVGPARAAGEAVLGSGLIRVDKPIPAFHSSRFHEFPGCRPHRGG